MGSVWIARDERLDIEVAVKFMSAEVATAPSAGARFEREAKAAAQLKSPHVVHIYDYGLEDGAPYIMMELLKGEDLATVLEREPRLSLARAADIIGQAAKALRAAHEARIVHRDIKPGNLFLAKVGDDTVVKVLDFGIAKETHLAPDRRGPTTTGAILGSPLYMSPEQARGGAVSDRSDLWSLGVVAFEMVTGAQPFLGASLGDVIAKICGDELPVASRYAPDLPPAADAFFARALARDPSRRFESARALADAFAEVGKATVTSEVAPPPAAAARTNASHLDETLPAPAPKENRDHTAATIAATAPLLSSTSSGLDRPAAPAAARPGARPPRGSALALAGVAIVSVLALRAPSIDPTRDPPLDPRPACIVYRGGPGRSRAPAQAPPNSARRAHRAGGGARAAAPPPPPSAVSPPERPLARRRAPRSLARRRAPPLRPPHRVAPPTVDPIFGLPK
ncbi:MAG: serine/threonine-protein kinase [Byssovorax sp.]